MDIQLLNFIIQPLLGGAAGYITNEYAINMLFNTYTPLKLGGVIPKTRDEFIENISRLVEEDIINKEKVQSILKDEAFSKNFDILVEDFLTNSLYEATDNITLNSEAFIADSLANAEKLVNNQVDIELPKLISLIADEAYLSDLVDISTIANATEKFYSYMVNFARETKAIDKLISRLIQSNKSTTLMSIIGSNASLAISKNIANAFLDMSHIKKSYGNNIDLLAKEVLDKANVYSLLHESIGTIIHQNKAKLKEAILSNLDGLLKSDSLDEALLKFSENIIDYGKNLSIPFIEILNESCTDNIRKIINNKAPEVFELIISFVEANKVELQKIIVESIEETIDQQDSTKKALLSMAKGSIFSTIAKNDISATVSEYLKDKNNVENLSLLLSVRIKQYLKTTTVSQAIALLEKKDILTAKKLKSFISDYMANNIKSIADRIILSVESLLKNEIFINAINNKILEIIKNKIIYSNNTEGLLKDSLNTYLSNLFNMQASEIFGMLSTNDTKLSQSIYELLDRHKDNIINSLSQNINGFIENKSLKDIVSEDLLDLANSQIAELTNKNIHYAKEKICQNDFYELYNKLNNIDNIQKSSSKVLKKGIINNLSPLLQKFIKGVSVKNLSKLDDAKLVEMAKSFMGNNLRPIMIFGGMLGVIAGLILAILQPNANVFAPVSLTSALTYSIVGFLTNAIAINMLFKPYNQIKAIRNIPFLKHFSLGYIVKNKENLAISMSSAIDEYLLTKDSMNELIDTYKDNIKSNILNNLSKNSYETLGTVCVSNKEQITSSIYSIAQNAVKQNTNAINNLCVNQIKSVKINDLAYSYKGKFSQYLIVSREKYNAKLLASLTKLATTDISIAEYLPKSVKDYINKSISDGLDNGFDSLISKISYDNVKKLAIDKSLSQVFSNEKADYIGTILNNNILNQGLAQRLIKITNNKLNSNMQIGNILDKKVAELSNNGLSKFFDNTNENSTKLLGLIKPSISKALQNKVTSNLNFLIKGAYNMMDGNSIIDTAVEKALLQKLPRLIEAKKDTVLEATSAYLNNNLLSMELKEIGLSINENLTKNNSTDTIKNILKPLEYIIKEKAATITVKDILEKLSLDNIQSICSAYENEMRLLIDGLNFSLALNKNTIMNSFNDLVINYANDIMNNTSINSLFININTNDLVYIANSITDILLEDKLVDTVLDDALKSIREYEKPLYVFDLINKDDFSKELNKAINILIDNTKIKDQIKEIISSLFDRAVENNLEFINSETKNYVISIISDATILTLRNNLSSILKDIEFDKIAKEQISAMKPKKIHTMFNSFAGKYFRTLMLYGFFGAVFGVNIIAGIILAGAYGIKSIIKKQP